MKIKLIIILSMLYAFNIFGQNPGGYYFNGGRDHPPGTGLALPYGTQDQNWKVSYSIIGPYVPAVVCGTQVNPPWWGGANYNPAYDWITHPNLNCNGSLSRHSCTPGTIDLYYRIDFAVTTIPFYLNLYMRADNSIIEIFQNTTSQSGSGWWQNPNTTNYAQSLTYVGYNNANAVSWVRCTGWNAGNNGNNNYIIVHTRSNSPQAGMDRSALSVEGWQMPPVNVAGSPTICPGTTAVYSVAPVAGATGYVWSLGGGLTVTGNPNSNVISVTAPLNATPGVVNIGVVANSSVCLNTGSLPVTILPSPVVSIIPSQTLVCQGTPVYLFGFGANTYTWSLQGSGTTTLNPAIVAPYQPVNVYSVIGTAPNSCTNTASVTVNTMPLPTIIITPNTFFTCAGIANTLTASGGSTYTWTSIPGSPTVNPLVINLTPSQTVVVSGTSANGCVNTSTLAFYPGTVIPISAPNVTLCTNAGSCTPIVATSTFAGWPPTFTWQPGGPVGSTVTVCPTVTTVYTVNASSPGGCPNTATLAVTMASNCCSQPTTGLTPLTSITSNMNGGSYLVENNITVSNGCILQNLEILTLPGVKITVPNNAALYLSHVHVYACGINMWKGFEIQDGGTIGTLNMPNTTSLIEDAEIAIDVAGTSLATSQVNQPVSINQVVFNKNYIGIYIHNADPAITTLTIPLTECVFTSRNLPFTKYPNPISWPTADITANGLRFAASPTTGLAPPYNLQNYAQSFLKASCSNPVLFSNQIGHIGIKINDVGNVAGSAPNTGVVIGGTSAFIANNPSYFNLFDGLGKGIEITNASFSTANNVFQNMQRYMISSGWFGGRGIDHIVNSQMNARLGLSPSGTSPSIDFGNRFWNCWDAVNIKGVFNVDIEYALFRSTRNVFSGYGPGIIGIITESNRFRNNISHCEFNNIDYNLWMNVTSGPYNVANNISNGTYADKITINQNYFGPEVTSATSLNPNTEYCGQAITFDGVNGANWQIVGNCDINSNKIDRAYRGIKVDAMAHYPMTIGGNNILISNDNVVQPSADQFGIYVSNSKDNLNIDQNTVTGSGYNGSWNTRLKLIRSAYNISGNNTSPRLTCNTVSDAIVGFEFEGSQPSTIWNNNNLNQKMLKGLSLVNQGVIGVQGNSTLSSGNKWSDNWNTMPHVWSNNWQTFVDASSPAFPNSFIWGTSPPVGLPVTNGGPNPFTMGGPTPSLSDKSIYGAECTSPNSYPAAPSQRFLSTDVTKKDENAKAYWNADVYPNPSNGNISITTTGISETITIRIFDLTGKIVYNKKFVDSSLANINLSDFKASIYLIEIQNANNQIIRKKLVKTE
ncbi:MAG: T9SS type A sorting domain-containing protein [Bacteroidetes bacterium]|nr:T9SS type A sorting domain-containing protein [Bacteroidota bacterium]